MPEEKMEAQQEMTKVKGGGEPTVQGKYTPDNPPAGWSYVNYANQPGGGFQCPDCSAVEDGNDVDGHSC